MPIKVDNILIRYISIIQKMYCVFNISKNIIIFILLIVRSDFQRKICEIMAFVLHLENRDQMAVNICF